MAIGDQYYVSVGADTTKLVASVNETITKMPTVKLNVDGSRVITQYKNITTATGEVFAVTQKTKQSLDGVISSLGSTAKQLDTATASTKKATTATKSMGSALDTASKSTKTLGQDFIETAGKVAKFGAITTLIGLVTGSIYEAWEITKQYDAAQTELIKVTSLAGDSLNQYREDAMDLASQLKTTTTAITEATTEFSKSGYTIDESLQLAEYSTQLSVISDEYMSSADSATFLIQVMKAYNMTTSEASKIIDSINETSNSFASSSADLT